MSAGSNTTSHAVCRSARFRPAKLSVAKSVKLADVYAWGNDTNQALGNGASLGDTTNLKLPQQLLAPAGCKFTSVDTGAEGLQAVATIARVPEPASMSLLASGGLTHLARRCCRA